MSCKSSLKRNARGTKIMGIRYCQPENKTKHGIIGGNVFFYKKKLHARDRILFEPAKIKTAWDAGESRMSFFSSESTEASVVKCGT